MSAPTRGVVQVARRFAENSGYPKRVDSSASSKDPEVAARLWTVSEELTGVGYDALRA